MALDLIVGTLYFKSDIDERWFDLDSYTIMSFYYYFTFGVKKTFPAIYEEEWPKIRKWILRECEGEVITQYKTNPYRNWIDLYFEFESDAVAFKLRWM